MKKNIIQRTEMWVSLIAGLIALFGTAKGILFLIQGVLPSNFRDYFLIAVTFICYFLILYKLLKPNPVKYDFLPNFDDIEHQAKLIRTSNHVRFRGIRFYEALKHKEFLESLKYPKEIKLHVMTKFPLPNTAAEEDHNQKLHEIREIIISLQEKGIKIILRESPGCPEYNELIFDRNILRRKKYDKKLMSAKNSEVEIFHWERARGQINKIIKEFDRVWELASYR